ncbi:hypothetical protein EV651_11214 [Kribbella sp. VKM Ac-2571]|nr:hypothetical protein EV651_11214 [Kribbella sp. VKM Ac-2571]
MPRDPEAFDRYAVEFHRCLARRSGRSEAENLLGQTFLLAFEWRHRYVGSADHALPRLDDIAINLIRRRHRDKVRQNRAG